MITSDQRKGRMKSLGSSDMAAVMNLNPWSSSFDLWAIKTGRAPEFDGNEATRRGNYLEESLMRFAEDRLQQTIERNVTILDPQGGPLAANLDGLCRPLSANIEGKSISGEIDPDLWGDPESDNVPEWVLIQTHVAMLCGELKQSFIPVILPIYKRFDLRWYCVPFNRELADIIRERADEFWTKNVLADIPPTDSVPSIEILKRIRREPGIIANVSDELVDQWIVAKESASEAKKEAEAAQAAVLAAMLPINADGAVTETGRMLDYPEIHRKGYAVEACTYRQLKIRSAKRAGKAMVMA